MIATLTPNPSLDLLFTADRLVWDDANRIPMPRRRPGGQGINVVRAVRALDPGQATRAIAPLGGPVGEELHHMLDAEGTPLTAVPITGETRVFVGVREAAAGRSLLLNPRGPELTATEVDALLEAVAGVLEEARSDGATTWLAACGSLLPGIDPAFYHEVGRLAREHGARFVPDGDGDALASAASTADLLVPNEREATRLLDRSVGSPDEAVAAARMLLERGPERVVVTLGARGAVVADEDGSWWARAIPPNDAAAATLAAASAVGAGDAFLAALLLAFGSGAAPHAALADAVAAGTAVLLSRGTALLRREDAREARTWVEVRAL